VRKQVEELKKLEMWKVLRPLWFVDATSAFLNTSTQKFLLNDSRDFKPIPNPSLELFPKLETENYWEYPTLFALHQFCAAAERRGVANRTIVAYIHTKTGTKSREEMQNAVLGDAACLECLERDPSKIMCGTRLSLEFFLHFSGNFWMARCSHIAAHNTFDLLLGKLWPQNGSPRSDQGQVPNGRSSPQFSVFPFCCQMVFLVFHSVGSMLSIGR